MYRMNHFSYDMQQRRIVCHGCETEFVIHCVEFPPKVIVCTGCEEVLVLVEHDPNTKSSFYHKLDELDES